MWSRECVQLSSKYPLNFPLHVWKVIINESDFWMVIVLQKLVVDLVWFVRLKWWKKSFKNTKNRKSKMSFVGKIINYLKCKAVKELRGVRRGVCDFFFFAVKPHHEKTKLQPFLQTTLFYFFCNFYGTNIGAIICSIWSCSSIIRLLKIERVVCL